MKIYHVFISEEYECPQLIGVFNNMGQAESFRAFAENNKPDYMSDAAVEISDVTMGNIASWFAYEASKKTGDLWSCVGEFVFDFENQKIINK